MPLPNLTEIILTSPIDSHVHLRNRANQIMRACLADLRLEFCGAVIEPNTSPELTTTKHGRMYRQDIDEELARSGLNLPFQYALMYYLTDDSDPEDLELGIDEGVFDGVKYYPANGSTNSARAVTDLQKIHPVLAMLVRKNREHAKAGKRKIPFCQHPERVGMKISPFDAERLYVGKELPELRQLFPDLPMVAEHITTKEAVAYVVNDDGPTWATIAPQHGLHNSSIIFQSGNEKLGTFRRGLRPGHVCWPLLKPEQDRLAIVDAIASGSRKFGAGTDRAWHNAETAKFIDHGCGGCYPHRALPLYAGIFDEIGSAEHFQRFVCENIPVGVYGMKPGNFQVRLIKDTAHMQKIPDKVWGQVIPFLAGEETPWRVEMVN